MDRTIYKLEKVQDQKNRTREDNPATFWKLKSNILEDNSPMEIIKNNVTNYQQNKSENSEEKDLSSCSAVLKINSPTGPLSVEVEIKLNTIKLLSPSKLLSRNEAHVSAAESILHMANKKYSNVTSAVNEYHESLTTFEDQILSIKNHAQNKLEELSPNENKLHLKVNEEQIQKMYTTKPVKRNSNKCRSVENQTQTKKRLMDCLLKKIHKKDLTPEYENKGRKSPVYNTVLGNEGMSDYIQNLKLKNDKVYEQNPGNSSNNKEFIPKKQTMVLQQAMQQNPQVINNKSRFSSISSFLLNMSRHSQNCNPQLIDSAQSIAPFKIDTNSDNLSKVINNTDNLHQYQNNTSFRRNIMTNMSNVMMSNGLENPIHTIKEESSIPNKFEQDLVSSIHSLNSYDSESASLDNDPSSVTTHDSDSETSSRLYIAEENDQIVSVIGDSRKRKFIYNNIGVNSDIEDYQSGIKRFREPKDISSKILKEETYIENGQKKAKNESFIMHDKTKEHTTTKSINFNYIPQIEPNMLQDYPLDLSSTAQFNFSNINKNLEVLHFKLENIDVNETSTLNNSSSLSCNSSLYSMLTNATDFKKKHETSFNIKEYKSQFHGYSNLTELKAPNLSTDVPNKKYIKGMIPTFGKLPYKCVVCTVEFGTVDLLWTHYKSKKHLHGLVDLGLLSDILKDTIRNTKIPIEKLIDPNTGNIIPEKLSHYLSNWNNKAKKNSKL